MNYWLMVDNNRIGPLTLDQVLGQPGVTMQTPVWYEGLADWTTVAAVPELAARLNPSPPFPTQQPYQQPYPQQPYQQPYTPYGQPLDEPCPPNYMVWSILVTLFCCLIGGVIAIIYSSGVNSAYAAGDLATAKSKSNSAKTWCIISASVGFVVSAIYVLIAIAGS